ncbi:MAG: hypothetical protein R8K21_04760 [Mariprofundales bacterium]
MKQINKNKYLHISFAEHRILIQSNDVVKVEFVLGKFRIHLKTKAMLDCDAVEIQYHNKPQHFPVCMGIKLWYGFIDHNDDNILSMDKLLLILNIEHLQQLQYI